MSVAAPTTMPACLKSVRQVRPQTVSWLWPGRVPLGKLAVLEGDPGLGKSLVTLDLCARLSTGQPFPDSSPGPGPANAVILSGEDSAGDTIRPRLRALGTNLERVFVLHSGDDHSGEPLRFPSDITELEKAVIQTEARLVILDPLVAFLQAGILIGDDVSVRRVLLPLAKLAERRECTMIIARHLNQSADARPFYRGGGPIGLVAACRCSWLIAREPFSYWLLPGQQLPDRVPPEAIPSDLEKWLAPLREKYPPPTPFEEDW